MTGDHEKRDEEREDFDELTDEGSFILEDWDELDQVLAEVEEEVSHDLGGVSHLHEDDAASIFVVEDGGRPVNEFDAASPEDLLFRPTGESHAGETFSESGLGWSGDDLNAEDIGIPVGGETRSDSGSFLRSEADEVDLDFTEDIELHGESGFFRSEGEEEAPWQQAGAQHEASTETRDFVSGSDEEEWSPYREADQHDGIEAVDRFEHGDEYPQVDADVEVEPELERPTMSLVEQSALADRSFLLGDEGTADDQGHGEQEFGQPTFGEPDDVGAEDLEAEYDPIYGAAPEDAAEQYGDHAEADEYTGESPDFDEYDDSYVDSSWEPQEERQRRRFPVAMIASVAAVLLVAGAGVSVYMLKPDWFAARPGSVLVDRTTVARPTLDVSVPEPSGVLEGVAVLETPNPLDPGAHLVTEPPVLASGQVDPTVDPATDPLVLPGSEPTEVAVADPGPASPAPVSADPGPDGVVLIEGSESGPAVVPVARDLVAVGEELQVGEPVDNGEATSPNPMSQGLASGDQAFAQLQNGNFFIGKVKKLHRDDITLSVGGGGEVTFSFEVIRGLGTVNSAEYRKLVRSEPGFIKLTNDNRLAGSIVKGGDGNVVVGLESSRIVIPESEIEEFGGAVPTGVSIEEEGDDAWIQQLIEKRLQKKREAEALRGAEGSTAEGFKREHELPVQPPR